MFQGTSGCLEREKRSLSSRVWQKDAWDGGQLLLADATF